MKRSSEQLMPALYYEHHRHFDDDLPFWIGLARRGGSPVLELGCGTGRVLIPLAEAGFRCYGVDHSREMLEFLQSQIPGSISHSISTIQTDFTSFKLDFQFPLIIMPCNTFSTLDNPSRLSVVAAIKEHLLPGGFFAVSIPNPDILSAEDSAEQQEIEMFFPHPLTRNPVQVSCEIVSAVEQVTFNWNYDHLMPDGKVERLRIATSHFLTSSSRYLQEFQQFGFRIENTFGDFDSSPFNDFSTNLIIIARKI
jgi:SAM-dependent methyltransferase